MKRHRPQIVLSITPRGALAWRVSPQGTRYTVEKESQADWEQCSSLEERRGELRTLLEEVRAGARGLLSARILLHPSWLIAATVTVPPAEDSEVAGYLKVWSERRWGALDKDELSWSWKRTTQRGENSNAVVLAARSATIVSLLEVLRASQLSPELITAEPFARASHAEAHDSTLTLLDVEPDGASFCVTNGHGPAELSWISYDSCESERVAAFLQYQIEQRTLERLVLDGELAGTFLALMPALEGAERPNWGEKAASALTGTLPGEFNARRLALTGALNFSHSGRDTLPNLAPYSPGAWSRLTRWRDSRWLYPAAAALAIILVGTLLMSNKVEASLGKKALDLSRSLEFDSYAARENIAILLEYERQRSDPLDAMLALKKALPEKIKLSGFEYDRKGTVTIEGITESYAGVEEFVVALNDSRDFENAATQEAKRQDDLVTFTIRCELRGGHR